MVAAAAKTDRQMKVVAPCRLLVNLSGLSKQYPQLATLSVIFLLGFHIVCRFLSHKSLFSQLAEEPVSGTQVQPILQSGQEAITVQGAPGFGRADPATIQPVKKLSVMFVQKQKPVPSPVRKESRREGRAVYPLRFDAVPARPAGLR